MLGLAVLNFLQQIDIGILHFFNVTIGHPTLDHFWLFITQLHKSKLIVIGVFLPALAAIIYIYRLESVKLLLAVGVAVALSDTIAYRGIKTFVDRPRPFQNPTISSWVRKVGQAHGSSFPSNHAANCFAAATVLSWYFRRGRYGFYTLAGAVALSRVALGVHYPSDVLAGSILGYLVGLLVTTELAKRIIAPKKSEEGWSWRVKSRRFSRD